MRKQASVCVIENALGQILLLQRSNPPYGFSLPGGKAEEGETIAECVMREVIIRTADEEKAVKELIKGEPLYKDVYDKL